MTPGSTNGPPALDDLMRAFLSRQAELTEDGFASPHGQEVEPYEVSAGFRTDPKEGFAEALTAVRLLRPAAGHAMRTPPPAFVNLLNSPASLPAVPLAAGHCPRLVRDLSALLGTDDLRALLSPPARGDWEVADGSHADPIDRLISAGVARMLGDTAAAERLIRSAETEFGADDPLIGNEVAATLWAAGEWEKAKAAWDGLEDGPATGFNRGMARLFLGDAAGACRSLRAAAEALPEGEGWHHLARLYLSVAEIRAAG